MAKRFLYLMISIWLSGIFFGCSNDYESTSGTLDPNVGQTTVVKESQNDVSLAPTSGKYNGDDAASYARKYAKRPNTKDYCYHPDQDCANFVSQALRNGGWTMTGLPPVKSSGWWYIKIYNDNGCRGRNHSDAWGDPKYLYYFINQSKRGIIKREDGNWPPPADLVPGDLIQIDYKKDRIDSGDHTMIITTMIPPPNGKPTYYVSYHSGPVFDKRDKSGNELDISFQLIYDRLNPDRLKPTVNFVYWKLKKSF